MRYERQERYDDATSDYYELRDMLFTLRHLRYYFHYCFIFAATLRLFDYFYVIFFSCRDADVMRHADDVDIYYYAMLY